jgi:anti-sigma factor RsiW
LTHRSQLEADRMEKLCSLHVIGELSSSERKELDAHLAVCEQCRLALRDFEQIALLDFAVLAAQRAPSQSSRERSLEQPDRMLSKIMRQLDTAPESASTRPIPTSKTNWRSQWSWLGAGSFIRPYLGWAVACVALIAAGYFSIQARRSAVSVRPDLSDALAHVRSEADSWRHRAEEVQSRQQLSAEQLDRSLAQRAATLATLETLRSSYINLQQKQTLLEQQLEDETTKLAQKEGDLQATRASLDQERQQVKMLDTELQSATTNADQARDRIAHLMQVSEKTSMPAAATEPRVTDAEAREIFGARDLHIVDVYDIDRSGKTRRTYGRVYYVNRRLLLFYAFDLEDRRNNRKAAGFQAWGFREPNSSKPENLGLFYVDDASLNRWVLRVSNADVLSRIDTVFVTLEPPQGSASPRGPKLLFASLGGPANHP